MNIDPRLYLVGQLLLGWSHQSTALPGKASIDGMIATADLILDRMKATEAEAARQRFAEARAIERNDPVHLWTTDSGPLCGFAAASFVTDILPDVTCDKCKRIMAERAIKRNDPACGNCGERNVSVYHKCPPDPRLAPSATAPTDRNDPEVEDRVRAFANRGLVSTEFRCFLCGVDIRALGRTKCCQRDSCPYVERQKLQIACDAQSQSAPIEPGSVWSESALDPTGEAGNVKE